MELLIYFHRYDYHCLSTIDALSNNDELITLMVSYQVHMGRMRTGWLIDYKTGLNVFVPL